MDSYIIKDFSPEIVISFEEQSYLQPDEKYRTEIGVPEIEEVPILQGDDNIFSGVNLDAIGSIASNKAKEFIIEFTRVFFRNKTPDRAYSKFILNLTEQPNVELNWVFQNFRVSFIFSITDEDYYCFTKYDDKTGKYESMSGPLTKKSYREIAEEVMETIG